MSKAQRKQCGKKFIYNFYCTLSNRQFAKRAKKRKTGKLKDRKVEGRSLHKK